MTRVENTWAQGWAFALAVHAVFLGWLVLAPPARRLDPRMPPTRVRIAERPRLPAPAPPAPLPEPIRPRRAPPPQRTATALPTSAPPPASAASPPPPSTPAVPRRFAVSMDAVVPGGGVAVPTAPPGAPAFTRGDPGGAPDGYDPALVAALTRPPRLLGKPSDAEMRAQYPEAARRDGIEGDVRLQILVSADGAVTEVRVLRRAGHGFDEAAARFLQRFRFQPADRGGIPVPAWIDWTYKFRLQD